MKILLMSNHTCASNLNKSCCKFYEQFVILDLENPCSLRNLYTFVTNFVCISAKFRRRIEITLNHLITSSNNFCFAQIFFLQEQCACTAMP